MPPTTPFASDTDKSWQAEISWQFEPTGFRDNHGSNLGDVLTPWAQPNGPSVAGNRVFRRSANDYYLSRTSAGNGGNFRSFTNPSYEQSNYSHVSLGRIELQSYVKSVTPGVASTDRKKGHLTTDDELSITDDDLESEVRRKYDQKNHGLDRVSYIYEGGEGEDEDDEDEIAPPKEIGVFGLFKYSTKLDYFLVMVGSLGALINGGSLPWYSLLFGLFVNKIALDKVLPAIHRDCMLAVGGGAIST